MIDINTLRFAVQLNKLDNSQLPASPLVVEDLLDRIEKAAKEHAALRAELSTEKGWIEDYKKQIVSLQNRLEASEHECTEQARLNGMGASREAALMAKLEAAEKERDALRAKIEAMERQDCSKQSMPAEVSREFVMDAIAQALGDAYDCTRVWSAWGYGTMSHDDFQLIAEDGDRLREIADAAIMAMGASAPKPCAQPASSMPYGWLRAIDEALVVAHVGVANESDTYEQAKAKLDNLLGFHVDAATDPAVNGGWKLVPIEPTLSMCIHGDNARENIDDGTRTPAIYRAMLAAAPEAKP